ncbi:hypothetical protein Tco_0387833, partial [Tanacetum coccineum]
ALMDLHELVLEDYLYSNGSRNGVFGRMYACLKYQHYKRKIQQLLFPVEQKD